VFLMTRAAMNMTYVLDMGGRNEESVVVGERALAKARQLGVGRSLGLLIMMNLIDCLAMLGRFDEASNWPMKRESGC